MVTFLDDSHFKQDLSYVDKLREKNLNQEIVFASGRATAGIVELIKRLKMTDIVRYIIGHNGAEIFDLKENKIIYQECMEDDVVFNIIEILEKMVLIIHLAYMIGISSIPTKILKNMRK